MSMLSRHGFSSRDEPTRRSPYHASLFALAVFVCLQAARAACLEWQIASIKERENISMINEELAREKRGSAAAQAQVQVISA